MNLFLFLLFLIAMKGVKGEEPFAKKLSDGVAPDVIDGVDENILELHVQYKDKGVKIGSELKPEEAKTAPHVEWKPAENKYYTLLMTDPDAPSRQDPKFREWQHWLVVNIPEGRLQEGETLTEYIGPKPPKGTDLHRYIFLLFEQPGGKQSFQEPFKSNTDYGSRKQFNTKSFIKKHKLGKPLSGIFFQAKYDGTY